METLTLNPKERKNTTGYKSYLPQTSGSKSVVQIHAIPTRVQARLDAQQAAWILGFSEHDIPVLIRCGLLKPLGDALARSARNYFAAVDIARLGESPEWLHDATQAVSQNWQTKNASRTKGQVGQESLAA